jgi:hypothetical protein
MFILFKLLIFYLKPNCRSFSALTANDRMKLTPSGTLGEVHYNPSQDPIIPADYFYPQLLDYLSIISRAKESGCRIITAHYMTHAVKIARQKYELPRLVILSEHPVSGEYIPDVGVLSGVLDFTCGTTLGEGKAPFGNLLVFSSLTFRSRTQRI